MLTQQEATHFYLDTKNRVVFYPYSIFREGIIANTEDIQHILAKDYKLAEQKAWTFLVLCVFILLKEVFSLLFVLVLASFYVIYEGQKSRSLRIKHKNLPRKKRIIGQPVFISFIALSIFVFLAAMMTLHKLIHMNIGNRSVSLDEFLVWLLITMVAVLGYIWFLTYIEDRAGTRYDKILYGKSDTVDTEIVRKR
ncbi:MAG: hypothetical protein ACQEQL_01760 [Pseudomonadota bacterium]